MVKELLAERVDKIAEMFGGEIPSWLDIISRNRLELFIDAGWQGNRKLKVTPADVVYYYAYGSRNISSGCRSLAGHTGDWRPIDELAKACLEVFKILNRPALEKEGKKYGMTLR